MPPGALPRALARLAVLALLLVGGVLASGWWSAASATVLPGPPAAPDVTGPTGPSRDLSPLWSWAEPVGGSSTCTVTGPATILGPLPCTPAWSPPGGLPAVDGTWQLSVQVVDASGLPALGSGGSPSYVLDRTAPAAPAVVPAAPSGSDTQPVFSLSTDEPATFSCQVVRPDGSVLSPWYACGSSAQVSLTPGVQGAWRLEARATDLAGNVSPVGSGTYVLDAAPPAAPVVTVDRPLGNQPDPRFTFTAPAGTETACRTSGPQGPIDAFQACGSPVFLDLRGLPDGPYTLEVRATDGAGNVSLDSATYVLDTTPPEPTAFLERPATSGPATSWTWRWSVETGATTTCRLTGPTGTKLDGACTSGVTAPMSGADDGTWTFTFVVTDEAGNARTETSTYVRDEALPGLTVTPPASPSSGRTPSWAISVGGGSTATCTLSLGGSVVQGPVGCSGGFTAAPLTDEGVYTLLVTVVDGDGAVTEDRSTFELDTTPPRGSLVLAAATSSTTSPTLTGSSPSRLRSATCRVVGVSGPTPCTVSAAGSVLPFDLTGRPDGTYVFELVLTDTAGNTATFTASYELDRTAPAAPAVAAPPSPGSSATPSWQLPGLRPGEELRCTLTGPDGVAAEVDCLPGTFTTALVTQGPHVLTVVLVDRAGNASAPTSTTYVFDSVAPVLGGVVLSGPPTSSRRSATWTFTVPEGVTATCTVTRDGTVVLATACTSPFVLDLTGRPDGTYRLQVVPRDAAGNAGTPSVGTFTLDTTPPATATVTGRPASPSRLARPTWTFTTPPGTTATCQVLRGGVALAPAQSCRDSFSVTLTADGDHQFVVHAVDAAGNVSTQAATDDYAFRSDAAAGVVFTRAPRGFVADAVQSWAFASEPGAVFTCTLLRGGQPVAGPAPCAGTFSTTLTREGDYELRVSATSGGQTTAEPATSGFTLDLTDPRPPVVQTDLRAAGRSPDVAWRWTVADPDVVLVECRLVRAGTAGTGWRDCTDTDTFTTTLTEQGDWVLQVRTTDRAGRTSPVVSSATYRYDTDAPASPSVASAAGAGGSAGTVTWTFAVPSGTTASCTLLVEGRVLDGAQDCSRGSFTASLTGRPAGTYTLLVRLVDGAGNESSSRASYALVRTDGSILRSSPVVPGPGGGGGGPGAPGAPAPSRPAAVAPPGPGRAPAAVLAAPGVRLPVPSELPPLTGVGTDVLAAPDGPGPVPLLGVPVLPEGLPDALRDALLGAVEEPALPVALVLLVMGFLLVQDRIDRRDPKLGQAPVDAEPDLGFEPALRAGGRS